MANCPIHTGWIYELRDGNLYAYMYNPNGANFFISLDDGEVIELRDYNSPDYTHKTNNDLDIIRVYKCKDYKFLFRMMTKDVAADDYIYGDGDVDEDDIELVWQRAKKMTIAEISAALGYEVEVRKEE
jgi:hypothetical protein